MIECDAVETHEVAPDAEVRSVEPLGHVVVRLAAVPVVFWVVLLHVVPVSV